MVRLLLKQGREKLDTVAHRSKLDIMAHVLECALEGIVKTNIMYRVNLSYSQLNAYLSLLLDLQHLQAVAKGGHTIYKTTPEGLKFLQSYHEIRSLIKEEQMSSVRSFEETMEKEEERKTVSLQRVNDSINEVRSGLEDLKKRVLKLESYTERKQCPYCGNEVLPLFKFCPYCGDSLLPTINKS